LDGGDSLSSGDFMQMQKHVNGFTLIELMITVAIVAVLAAVAYPSYTNQIRRSHRAEGRDMLLQIQVAQEKYFLSNNSYGTLANLVAQAPIAGLNSSTSLTANGYFKITITPATPTTTYEAVADAQGSQQKDSYCAKFAVTNTGDKSNTTNPDCWNK